VKVKTVLMTWLAVRQALSRSPSASRPLKTGRKAVPSAPPATSVNKVSGTRLAVT
jgi:hypothetical protein